MFVEVAFPLPLNRTFHYRLPNGDPPETFLGRRVLAPFGKKSMVGYAVGSLDQTPPFPTKLIHHWVDAQALLDPSHLELARWLAETYLCSFGEALGAILPAHLQAPKRAVTEIDGAPQPGPFLGPLEPPGTPAIVLSAEQKRILDQFLKATESGANPPFLLRGITDSGKTELYLRTIDHVLKQGRQALFLLPEIALTPPFIDRLTTRYSAARVGVWHSGLSAGARYRTWMAARAGKVQVLLGARSAVFAPFPRLGAIIFDEEHEPSYKQEDRPRYHAREVALRRAKSAGATMIMGSATPSLESYWNAKKGTYTLVELTSRVEMRELPPVTLIDRRGPGVEINPAVQQAAPAPHPTEPPKEGKGHRRSFDVFSEPLKIALEQRLARREQVLLFVNRRGFTPFMRCSKCGWVSRCPRCSMTMTHHIGDELKVPKSKKKKAAADAAPPSKHYMQCHACLRRERVPIQCPSCHSMRLGQFGIGTQRVEEEVKSLFPFVKIARLDRDAAQSRKMYEKIYRAFSAKELDVLVGTQMIAKGFDFPGVTLVGVVDADISLHLPDFRSAERTFQLMAQVAGRTGRGDLGGKVLVQTHHPEHYALQSAQKHDYVRFYEEEMGHREALNYPPYCRLINLVIRGRKEAVVITSSDELAEQLRAIPGGAGEILGPAPAPHSRMRAQFRYQIVIKGTEETLGSYKEFLRGKKLGKAFLTVDIDPMDLL